MHSLAKQSVVRLKDFRPGELGNKVSKAVSSFAGQVSGVAKNTDGFVRSNPWAAVGAVALAGLAAGLVVSLNARRLRQKAAAHSRHTDNAPEVGGG